MVVDLGKLSGVQRIVTTLAFTLLILYGLTKKPYLFTPAIVFGILAVLLWLARRLYEGDLFKKAMRLAEGGEHREALSLLMRRRKHGRSTKRTVRQKLSQKISDGLRR